VSFVAFLIRENRWSLLAEILAEEIALRYVRSSFSPGSVHWTSISEYVSLLDSESKKRSRISYHSDLLKERHSTGGLAAILPITEFSEADYLLYLRGELNKETSFGLDWRPWSTMYLQHVPKFFVAAQREKNAHTLSTWFGFDDVSHFKEF
jgi:hypothetical protein